MSRKTEESATPRFKVEDKVRVKWGVIDLNFPDFPLGGCSGTVTEIVTQKGTIYSVFKLDDRTQASLHPIYRKRCVRDGLDWETMGLGEDEIEIDDGTQVVMEQPTEIPLESIELKKKDPNYRTISDYTYWSHNWR